ncbi:hypothetical protein GWI33_012050 [Rhynchophorus ferrugineus]|uniref:Uncharacterized protein n=1 Tax=Rhynchophorus ferrugineus TaxID=354439 RepID=A0A834I9H0_RHYFE|nr:hypothetical protein GWI33_012050 [Rhynchophorus ferrugineus]
MICLASIPYQPQSAEPFVARLRFHLNNEFVGPFVANRREKRKNMERGSPCLIYFGSGTKPTTSGALCDDEGRNRRGDGGFVPILCPSRLPNPRSPPPIPTFTTREMATKSAFLLLGLSFRVMTSPRIDLDPGLAVLSILIISRDIFLKTYSCL